MRLRFARTALRRTLATVLLALLTTAIALAADKALHVGDTLPALRGDALNGREVTLPDAARGRAALVVMGFTFDSRHEVIAWGKRFHETHGARNDVTLFECPMMGTAAWMGKPFIMRSMRRSTPADLHGNVVTVWGSNSGWKRRVGYAEKNAAYLLLLDREGRLAWRHVGPPTVAAWDSLGVELERLGVR